MKTIKFIDEYIDRLNFLRDEICVATPKDKLKESYAYCRVVSQLDILNVIKIKLEDELNANN